MRTIRIAILATLLVTGGASAQQPGADPMGDNLVPPELVMMHQQEIALTDEQRSYIVAEIGSAQQKATDIQWKMQREVDQMGTILKKDPVDEKAMLAQLDTILALERDIKRIHLTLVERIKNRLTPQQRAELQKLKATGAK
jgi:Spy/CpxP family protein refolding chaperone